MGQQEGKGLSPCSSEAVGRGIQPLTSQNPRKLSLNARGKVQQWVVSSARASPFTQAQDCSPLGGPGGRRWSQPRQAPSAGAGSPGKLDPYRPAKEEGQERRPHFDKVLSPGLYVAFQAAGNPTRGKGGGAAGRGPSGREE